MGEGKGLEQTLAIAKALADPNRLRAVAGLAERERCACELVAMLGLAQATVSRHMGLLTRAGLVVARRAGRWIYYRLPQKEDTPPAAVRDALAWVLAAAGRKQRRRGQ